MPQIWDEYCAGEPELIRLERIKDFKALQEKQKAMRAAARKDREAAKAAGVWLLGGTCGGGKDALA